MEILSRDQLPRGGFAGVREHRLVMDPGLFGEGKPDANHWPGFGGFVYLADARFLPGGDTGMHDHREIDVISVMVEGRIRHEGSLEHGQSLEADQVQVQRAGGEGFSHNEINPDDKENRMIQLWVLPDRKGESAAYKSYALEKGGVTRVYGGDSAQQDTFAAQTQVDVALLDGGQSMDINVPFVAYLVRGRGFANESDVAEGDLLRGDALTFDAVEDAQLIIIHLRQ